MKFTNAAIIALSATTAASTITTTAAFAFKQVTPSTSTYSTSTNTALHMASSFNKLPSPSPSGNSDRSEALPFAARPPALDGELPGDVGFDPFGFASTKDDLYKYREAEVKYARLAMLAAVGWPLSERLDRPIADTLDMQPMLDASNRVPALLNGGLGKISPVHWAVCLAAAAAIDLHGIRKSQENVPGCFPGNLGFDPLGLYPQDVEGQRRMQLAEIKHGRLAMLAITAFAYQEFARQYAVVDQTPIFFKPANVVIDQYGQSGALTPQF
jgi:hypothetical protein